MSSKNVKQVMWVAIRTLLLNDGRLQDRLASAAVPLTSLPSANNLPKQVQGALDSIVRDLTNELTTGDEGTIAATTRKMSDEDAKRIAEEILRLYTELLGGI